MSKIVVSGYMVRYPMGGLLLAYFNYALGLHRLGHQVVYIEDSGWPESCYDPATDTPGSSPAPGLKILRELLKKYDVPARVYFVDSQSGEVYGGTRDDVQRELRDADVLLNVGGVCHLEEFALCRHRVLIDMDPFFTQIGEFAGKILDGYHAFFSYGMNIAKPNCSIPTGGRNWIGTVPPVVPEMWAPAPPGRVFTTVASWTAYGQTTFQGETYGQKDMEFIKLIDLPRRTTQPLELALNGGEEIRPRFSDAGWSIIDSADVTLDLTRYMRYICGSRGEFSAAKNAYVKTRSGWFSDRTVCYLAASRPVVIQQTGFSDWLPTGHGVLGFDTLDEAADCLAQVDAEYESHSWAAREIAMEFFDYHKVLPRLIDPAAVSRERGK